KTVDGKKIIAPDNSADYEYRTKNFPYKITADDLCCKLFKAHGFTWGGDCWDDEWDYQHFFIEEGITRCRKVLVASGKHFSWHF
ncbi:MAG: M15 family metallopeptidase, partial [Selenomonadaceae bacterium]|nr:M15 family metallopeptidase [Selenomonadaceae bacterium]